MNLNNLKLSTGTLARKCFYHIIYMRPIYIYWTNYLRSGENSPFPPLAPASMNVDPWLSFRLHSLRSTRRFPSVCAGTSLVRAGRPRWLHHLSPGGSVRVAVQRGEDFCSLPLRRRRSPIQGHGQVGVD